MFRRSWDALPKDPYFEPDLKKLGYFINEDDEIRNIQNPDFYFKYFINKNERYNECQRYAMNQAIADELDVRFAAAGLVKHRLPLGAGATDPHVPILASADLSACAHVILIVGESQQDLGVFSYRTVCGRGGVRAGSALSYAGAGAGLVVANPGQLFWDPAAARALGPLGRLGMAMPSAVHAGHVAGPEHRVPANGSVEDHVAYVFGTALPHLLGGGGASPAVHVVGVGDGADAVEAYLDRDEAWAAWAPRLGSLTIMGGLYDGINARVPGFRAFLRDRARAYIVSGEPLGTPLSGPDGNAGEPRFTDFGCPVFSAGESVNLECVPVRARSAALEWIAEVGADEAYVNPPVAVGTGAASLEADAGW